MQMKLTLDNLNAGVNYWRKFKPHWEKDFGNCLYMQLQAWKANGLTEQWWDRIQRTVKEWKAYRPIKMSVIRERGLERLAELDSIHSNMLIHRDIENDGLETVNWNEIADLFRIADEIKPVDKPTFPSKLCHFIFPNLYPVADQEELGVGCIYRYYWINCSQIWTDCQIKEDLIAILKDEIVRSALQCQDQSGITISPYFPWSTKITELCLTGNRHRD